eukprot:5197586-Amphidinium_carterae.1
MACLTRATDGVTASKGSCRKSLCVLDCAAGFAVGTGHVQAWQPIALLLQPLVLCAGLKPATRLSVCENRDDERVVRDRVHESAQSKATTQESQLHVAAKRCIALVQTSTGGLEEVV